MKKQIQFFKPGKHTAMNGMTLEYTEAQLMACAKAYDPEVFKSPLVVGHPTMDAPAYGWAGTLSYTDGILSLDTVDQLDAEFAETVNDGRFGKVSPSFYLPDAPNNPKPGTLYLKHIGFLGAAAVKGLKTASFSENEEGVVAFIDWDQMSILSLFRKVRELVITKFGVEDADKALPFYEIESLTMSAAQVDDNAFNFSENNPEFNQGDTMTPQEKQKMDQLEADNATLMTANTTLTADNTEKESKITSFAEAEETRKTAATHDGNVSFAEGLVSAGKLLPADKDVTVSTLDQLAKATGEVSYGEGDDKKTVTPLELHKNQLFAAPKVVVFGETIKGDVAVAASGKEVAVRARAYKSKLELQGSHVSFSEAVDAVTADKDK